MTIFEGSCELSSLAIYLCIQLLHQSHYIHIIHCTLYILYKFYRIIPKSGKFFMLLENKCVHRLLLALAIVHSAQHASHVCLDD